ncbi:helix-turn-helix domain-containing protein [Leptospira kmetyi]|uniref:Helix-turn-helix domain-containing protein n=1 Tax=Leptospira kmetyi TaxID=408139 RepID=A0ABX4N6A8_9LEPT|nr:helix-turn-helix domain-containing protein [Leptospira kmetyi]PJZ28720.1 hypothetical protein CH378_16085 [Leptospira kmetyi]PJZ39508.1 hypothetical protein CH370_20850 [Leptospira kmetyi]
MEEIHLRVPRAFLRDKRVKPKEKAIMMAVFGAMWSFSGRGDLCYASIGLGPDDEDNPKIGKATLCSRSSLSKNTVVKYKKRLKDLGWISPIREGRGKNDSITLFEFAQVVQPSQNPKNEDSKTSNIPIEVFQNPTTLGDDSSGVPQGDGMLVQDICTDSIESTDESDKFVSQNQPQVTPKLSLESLEKKFGKDILSKALDIASARGMKSNLKYVLGICRNLDTIEIKPEQTQSQKPTWDDFMNWSRERLTRSSMEILERTQIELNLNGLLVLTEMPESLKMIVFKYFTEECKNKIPVYFFKPSAERQNAA